MKISFKFLTFCLISIFLVMSYRATISTTGGLAQPTAGKFTQTTQLSGQALIDWMIYKGVTNATRIPTITNGTKTIPSGPIAINALVKLISPGYFKVYDSTKKGSYGAMSYGFDNNWLTKYGNTIVTLTPNTAQIAIIQNNGALPTPTQISAANTLNISAAQKTKLVTFLTNLLNGYAKILLSFKATNNAGQTYDLYLVDPNPGQIKITGGQYMSTIVAEILSQWNWKGN